MGEGMGSGGIHNGHGPTPFFVLATTETPSSGEPSALPSGKVHMEGRSHHLWLSRERDRLRHGRSHFTGPK
jgi:hypothetical protein